MLGAERLADLAELEPGLPRERQALLKTVGHALHDFCEPEKPKPPTTAIELLARIGCAMETFWLHLKALLGFIGLTLETLFRSLVRPASWRVTPLVANIEKSGLDAVPIIALLTFLVGAVIAFLGATVLANFGATIYTVNLVVFSFLREFAVLLTAILMAGRTASAFTAQIGSMKANEEIDAIRALGLNPIELLVLPRVLALLVSLPMLTFVGMLCGIVGGMTVCAWTLDIPPAMFLSIMEDGIGVQHFLVGISKAPAVRLPDRRDRLPGRLQGQRQRPVGGRAHHHQRGPLDLRGDPARRPRRAVLHGDGLVNQDNPQAIIQVRDLCNRFGAQAVHEHLDLDVRRGEILGVVGGSGTGKSVLLRSIVGLRRPTSGSVRVFGEDLLQLPEERRSLVERRFGVLFQQGALFSSLTVVENVALPLIENAGLPRADAEHLAQVKLALAGLPANAGDKYPASLSGGMIKRAALARALALDPDILFLDEPTAGLDPIGAAAFDNLIRTLRDALGLTVFLVTHDLDTLYTICDRVAVLSQKKVLVVDTLERVAATDDAWVREYFHGPRGRAAHQAAAVPENH
ncbi:ABC transporter ATP-binding protein [Pseudomonas aeruginosa]|nr:ABC transporter ATP-binding protein [Pseudomonas aeruginosa]